jgi:hypothetical protein
MPRFHRTGRLYAAGSTSVCPDGIGWVVDPRRLLLRPLLMAGLVLVAGVVLGIVLLALDFGILGMVAMLGAIPVAFVAWLLANDR